MDSLSNSKIPTPLPPKALAEFKSIFEEEFGTNLTNSEATQKALTILELFKVLVSNEDESELDLSNINNDK